MPLEIPTENFWKYTKKITKSGYIAQEQCCSGLGQKDHSLFIICTYTVFEYFS